MNRSERLAAFMERYSDLPTTWGVDDCSACPARWLEEETGRAVAYPAYSSPDEAAAVKLRAGGLLSIWESQLADAGVFERAGEPQLGDVAILDSRLYGQIGCIVLAGRVAAVRKLGGGWHPIGPVRQFVKVWAVE